MKLLEVKIQIAEKKEAEDLPDSAVNWQTTRAIMDLDEITCMYDSFDDGVKVFGRDFEFFVKNYILNDLAEMKLGFKPLPKLNLSIPLNGDGTCDEAGTGKMPKCKLCGTTVTMDEKTGYLICEICGVQ